MSPLNIDENTLFWFKLLEKMDYCIEVLDTEARIVYASPVLKEISRSSHSSLEGVYISELFNFTLDNSILLQTNKSKQRSSNKLGALGDDKNFYYLIDVLPIFIDSTYCGIIALSKYFRSFADINNTLMQWNDIVSGFFATSSPDGKITFADIITENAQMKKTIEHAQAIAQNFGEVLIIGETGSGKELFAQSIHNFTYAEEAPFVAINCSAIPDNLFESTLFGNTKGAYTGAYERKGILEEANGGTLFLDEMNSMSLDAQAKLLRCIETRTYSRLGSNKQVSFDCRIISAVNNDPFHAVQNGSLRADLFYRLASNIIEIPPLRERKEDIIGLAKFFIPQLSLQARKSIQDMSDEVADAFVQYPWPGNVRELRNVLVYGINIAPPSSTILTLDMLPHYFLRKLTPQVNTYKIADDLFNIDIREAKKILTEEFEREYILQALKKNNGNLSLTAKSMEMSRQYLYQMIKRLNISIDEARKR